MDDVYNGPSPTISFYTIKRKEFSPSLWRRYHIINFSFEFNISHRTTIDVSHSFTIQKSLSDAEKFRVCYDEIDEAVGMILTSLPLSEYGRLWLIELAWHETLEAVTSTPSWGSTVHDLDFKVLVRNRRVINPPEEISESFMVRAADSSIQSLEKYEIDYGNVTEFSCCICLEDFTGEGCEALCMPCDHVFHGDCIEEWLRTTHYCPICRFEMSTA